MGSKILWALVVGFLAGVFARSFMALSWPWVIFLVLLGIVTWMFVFVDKEKRLVLTVIGSMLIACGGGVFRMDRAILVADPFLNAQLDKKITLEGVVFAEPDVRETGTRLSVRARSIIIGSSRVPVDAGILVLAPSNAGISYGDVIQANGTLRSPQAFDTGDGRSFDYPNFLAKDGMLYQLAFAHVEQTGMNRSDLIRSAAIKAKHLFLGGLQSVLPEPESGLAGGITVGDKRSIGGDLSAQFQRVSLIHMVVLSGYNITVVINAAAQLLSFASRFAQFGGSTVIVVFFVLMSGGAASAIRAGAMAVLAMYARLSGRLFIAVRALAVVAAVMVAWNPYILAFDPSFQLSALATLGLVLLTPHIAVRLGFMSERFGIREIIASTISTQIAVLPLLLYQNGNLSIVSLPANLLALIPVPFAMFASFIAAAGGMLFGSYAVVLALPAYVLLSYIIRVAQFFASFPYASVSVPAFSPWFMFAAYGVLIVAVWMLEKRKSRVQDPAISVDR